MENDFSKVSLGFAEFVAQLVHETFDAILDAQSYQIDKYLGFEKALNTPNSEFAAKYLTTEEINEYMLAELGFELKDYTALTKDQIVILSEILKKTASGETEKSDLTKAQFDLVYNEILGKLINERKSKIQMFVERPELARLFVDSGEIKAKLNLSCLNEEVKSASTQTSTARKSTKTARASVPVAEKVSFEVKKLDFSRTQLSSKIAGIKATEITDKETGLKTILIDKESLKNKDVSLNIPTTRIIANPISSTNTTTISSEVIIKFRSI